MLHIKGYTNDQQTQKRISTPTGIMGKQTKAITQCQCAPISTASVVSVMTSVAGERYEGIILPYLSVEV